MAASTLLSCFPGAQMGRVFPSVWCPQMRNESVRMQSMLDAGGRSAGPRLGRGRDGCPDALLGPASREGSRIRALGGQKGRPPPCGLLARRALSLLSMVWPGRGYSPGGRVWEDQRLRGVKAQILILAWRKPIPSATLWLAGRVGGSRIKGRFPRPAQQLPSRGASLGGGAKSGSWSPPHSTGVGPWKGQDRGIFPKNPAKKSIQEKPDDLFKARER